MALHKRRTTERQRFINHEERIELYLRDSGICQTCNSPVSIDDFEIAHKIANTKANLKRWGKSVIDSPKNKATTHRGACNSAQNIGFNPEKSKALAEEIMGVKS